MKNIVEPSYIAFTRVAVRDGMGVSSLTARLLLARIDRDSKALLEARAELLRLRSEATK